MRESGTLEGTSFFSSKRGAVFEYEVQIFHFPRLRKEHISLEMPLKGVYRRDNPARKE
jgi:hypothetical protein